MHASYSKGSYRANEGAVIGYNRVPALPATRRGALLGLGLGSNALSSFNDTYSYLPRPLIDARYPVLTADLSLPATAGFTFGNDDCIAATDSAWTFMKSATGVNAKTDKMWLVGVSGFTSTALNWAIRNAGNVAGMGLVLPILRLDAAYQGDIGGNRAAIGTAHGVTYPTAIPNLATHDPNSYSNADKALLAMPIHLWTSDDDPYTTTAQAQTWAASVNAQTGLSNVVVESLGAVGHTFSAVTGNVLTAWLDSQGGRA